MPEDFAPWATVAQTLGIGAVLWFVLLRLEAAMRSVEVALNRLSLQMALLLDRSHRPEEAVERLVRDSANKG